MGHMAQSHQHGQNPYAMGHAQSGMQNRYRPGGPNPPPPPMPPQHAPPQQLSSLGMSGLNGMGPGPEGGWGGYGNGAPQHNCRAAVPTSQGYAPQQSAPAASLGDYGAQPTANNGSADGGVPSPTGSNSSQLQPKELFATSAAASESDSNSPRPLWGSACTSSNGFTLFGGFASSANGSGMSSPVTSPSDRVIAPGGEASKGFSLSAADSETARAGMRVLTDGDDGRHGALEVDEEDESASRMLGQIDALFGKEDKDEADAEMTISRQAFIKRHQLDKLVATAVDRAMRHQVASPVEFVAHELLRACAQMQGSQAGAQPVA